MSTQKEKDIHIGKGKQLQAILQSTLQTFFDSTLNSIATGYQVFPSQAYNASIDFLSNSKMEITMA